MKRSIIISVFILMFGWAVYEFISSSESDESNQQTISNENNDESSVSSNIEITESDNGEEGLEIGNIAPETMLKTLDGEEIYLSDYRGKRVLLNFWATWCPPCRAEMPDMEKFHQDTDIEIIAVNLIETESNQGQVDNFIDEYSLTFSVMLDEGNEAANTYQIQPIPTSYLINSDGTIHNKAFGALNYDMMVQEFEKMN